MKSLVRQYYNERHAKMSWIMYMNRFLKILKH